MAANFYTIDYRVVAVPVPNKYHKDSLFRKLESVLESCCKDPYIPLLRAVINFWCM